MLLAASPIGLVCADLPTAPGRGEVTAEEEDNIIMCEQDKAVGHGVRGSRKAAAGREEQLGGASGGGAC
jgi:hypothetical protein